MAFFNLPPVDDKTLLGPDSAGKPGEWRPIDLDALAGSLAIDETQVRPDELKSIPDSWAQVQLTSDALLSRRHGARDAVVAQWRGLLALLALQPLLAAEYDLRITPVGFDPASRTASSLRGLLTDLLPVQTLAPTPSWEQLSLIELIPAGSDAATLVGVTSPMTLVAPARTVGRLDLPIPWLRTGLGDPTAEAARTALSLEAWPILIRYLDGLIAAVRIEVDRLRVENRDKLIRHLEDFQGACARIDDAKREHEARRLSAAWPHTFYQPLGATWVPQRHGGSECRLVLRSGGSADIARAILVDPALAETIGKPANVIRLWGGYTLQDAQSPATLKVIRDQAAKQDVLVLQPEDFFTPDLVRLQDNAAVPANAPGFEASLLPLAPIALLFCPNAKSLAGRVRIRNRGDGDSEVALDLTLEGENGSDIVHPMTRTYPAASIVRMPAPVDLAIWPNFEASDWPWTFLRFQYNPRSELQTRFGASVDLIVRDALAAPDGERLGRLAEWGARHGKTVDKRLVPGRLGEVQGGDGKLLLRSLRPIENDTLVSGFQESRAGVEAIFFCRKRSDREPSVPTGCVLVERAAAGGGGDSSTIAFDFGTTNTIAYAEVEGKEARRIGFANRVHFPVRLAVNERVRASEYTSFFPIHAHDMPLPTVAKRREFEQLSPELRPIYDSWDERIGFSHFAFFMPQPDQALASDMLIALVDQGRLRFDLKWGEDPRLNRLVQSFLCELMMMSAAEIVERGGSVDRITWRFSYPQSFTPTIKDGFETAVRGAHEQLFGPTPDERKKATLDLVTEGAAAAAYFMSDDEQKLKSRGKLMLMLDIGGGSTDMAIREDQSLIWRGSVKLAGTDFFRRYLVNNFGLMEAFDSKAVGSLVASQSTPNQLDTLARKRQLVDLIVARRGFSEDFAKLFSQNAQDRVWMGLRQCATVALGGMIYYLGMVLRALRDADDAKITDEHLGEMTVAFGGRGSSLFRQLDPHGDERLNLSDICALAVLPADGDADAATIMPEFSLNPKEEVVRGLLRGVVEAPMATGRRVRRAGGGIDRSLPVGLDLSAEATVKGESADLAFDTFIPRLLDAKRVTGVDLGQMQVFLKGLRQLTGLTIDIDSLGARQTLAQNTRTGINQSLAKLRPEDREDGDTQTLEPPFITALRLLVELMSEPIGERDKRVQVRQRG